MADLQRALSAAGIGFQRNPAERTYAVSAIPAIVVTDGLGNELGRIGGLVALYREGRFAESIVQQALRFRP